MTDERETGGRETDERGTDKRETKDTEFIAGKPGGGGTLTW